MTGEQIGKLRDIITQSFNEASFVQCLRIRLNKNLYDYAPNGNFPYMVFTLIDGARMEGWDHELIEGLRLERPRNQELLKLSLELKTSADSIYDTDATKPSSLQRLINSNPMFKPWVLMEGLSHASNCTCRIEITTENGRVSYGTGFLVAPDLILSNHHVFENVIRNPALSANTICRFDYSHRPDGSLNTGLEVKLATDPIVCYSTYSALDDAPPQDINAAWPADQCDYALVRLEKEVGNLPFGANAELATPSNDNKRGWIKAVNTNPDALKVKANVIILQHPKSLPLTLAIGLQACLGQDALRRRVRYDVNTEPGSSGSPCFDEHFNWIALHNLGAPDRNPEYNQGITAEAVISDLKNRGINYLDICM